MITDFFKGLLVGVIAPVIIFAVVLFFVISNRREKEIVRYVEIQQQIETLREDYVNRDPLDFIDSIDGVRGAADSAYGDFTRKRDEALQRFRSGLPD
jgi:hypothetical protein